MVRLTHSLKVLCMIFFYIVPTPSIMIMMRAVLGKPTQLSLQWQAPLEPNGNLVSYTVYCKTFPGQPVCDVCDHNSMHSFSCGDSEQNTPYSQHAVLPVSLSTIATVGGFLPFTNYTCFITANTSAGESDPSVPTSAVTDESGELLFTFSVYCK